MPFVRDLDPTFVASLNRLHEDTGSWWHRLANDPEVFLAVRNNAINAYANGGSVGRIRWDGNTIKLLVHHAYLVFPDRAAQAPYVDLLDPAGPPKPVVITTADEFAAHLKRIKTVVRTHSHRERRGENEIAARLPLVIDIEAAFDTATEETESEFEGDTLRQGRIDIVAVSQEGRLVFTEAKVFKNRELRSTRVPAVCEQLVLYHRWIKEHVDEIQAAYARLRSTYRDLRGGFFQNRFENVNADLTIDPVPRLLVFDFDSHQEKAAKPIRESVCEGVARAIPSFTRDHIRFVGSSNNVAAGHLL